MEKEELYSTSIPNQGQQRVKVVLDAEGCVINKKYEVVFVDEYSNWYLIGFFDNLKDAEPELNDYLEGYTLADGEGEGEVPQFGDSGNLGHLEEYASTFSTCFDREIWVEEGSVAVRGFVFN